MNISDKNFNTEMVLLILLILIIITPQVAYSFNVSTMKLNHTAQPGQELRGQIIVSNNQEKIEQIKVFPGDWYRNENGKKVFTLAGNVDRSFTPWLTSLTPRQFVLEPGESKTVKYTIKVPVKVTGKDGSESLAPGGFYFGVINVENKPSSINEKVNQEVRKVGLLAKLRYAIRLDLMIPQNIERKGTIANIEVKKTKENIELFTLFKNIGNVILKSSGYIQLRGINGNLEMKKNINNFEVLPGGKRKITSRIKNNLQPGQYTLLSVIDYGGDVLIAGEKVFQIDENGRIRDPEWD
jgi:hypothetical protein